MTSQAHSFRQKSLSQNFTLGRIEAFESQSCSSEATPGLPLQGRQKNYLRAAYSHKCATSQRHGPQVCPLAFKKRARGKLFMSVDPKSPHHKEKFLFFLFIVSTSDDGCVGNLPWQSFRGTYKSNHHAVRLTRIVMYVSYFSIKLGVGKEKSLPVVFPPVFFF